MVQRFTYIPSNHFAVSKEARSMCTRYFDFVNRCTDRSSPLNSSKHLASKATVEVRHSRRSRPALPALGEVARGGVRACSRLFGAWRRLGARGWLGRSDSGCGLRSGRGRLQVSRGRRAGERGGRSATQRREQQPAQQRNATLSLGGRGRVSGPEEPGEQELRLGHVRLRSGRGGLRGGRGCRRGGRGPASTTGAHRGRGGGPARYPFQLLPCRLQCFS